MESEREGKKTLASSNMAFFLNKPRCVFFFFKDCRASQSTDAFPKRD